MALKKFSIIAASCLLVFVFVVAVFSIKNDSLTMDEVAHLPTGYSYLTQKDMRLNPEHPPLLKDLAAVPLLFIKDINFPSGLPSWQEEINGQWDFGFNFLYQSNNPADKMIFWGRIPMILILVILGFYVFRWTRELFGDKAGLLALFLFSFSPTFMAHGRLVTTDVGAAVGVFIATYYFVKTLKSPTKKNIILAGIAFGLAQLCKFSVILLVPFFALLGLVWWLVKSGKLWQTLKILLLVFVIGFILIWPVYQYHVWNYPAEKQAMDAEVFIKDYPDFIQKPILSAADNQILRPYAQYLTGLFMVFHRAAFGNTGYFLGEISNLGWKNYFPIVYFIKEPLTFHILTLIALLYAVWLIRKPLWQDTKNRTFGWIKSHFPEFAMLAFIGVYWLTSLTSNLNIGVRHLLPVFPFTFVLVSSGIVKWIEGIKKIPLKKMAISFVSVLLGWQMISFLSCFPHYIAYSNELTGGPDKTYIYTVDSNLDWGQDLKRLTRWVDEKGINKIYVDYFGGGDVEYYLKEKYAPWWGSRDSSEFPKNNYLAVSATFLQGGKGEPIPGFTETTGYYRWLNKYEPIEKIGHSIFIYYID